MKNLLFVFSIVFLTSCSSDEDISFDTGDIQIRVENRSEVTFKKVKIGGELMQNHYGKIEAGESSDYLRFEVAYRYGFITLKARGEEYGLLPVDYDGETPLPAGKYTYQLDLDEEDRLQLTFKED